MRSEIVIEVRPHNGQCAYGEWTDVSDPDVPPWVERVVTDEIADRLSEARERGERPALEDEGVVEEGGARWLWRVLVEGAK